MSQRLGLFNSDQPDDGFLILLKVLGVHWPHLMFIVSMTDTLSRASGESVGFRVITLFSGSSLTLWVGEFKLSLQWAYRSAR